MITALSKGRLWASTLSEQLRTSIRDSGLSCIRDREAGRNHSRSRGTIPQRRERPSVGDSRQVSQSAQIGTHTTESRRLIIAGGRWLNPIGFQAIFEDATASRQL